MDPVRFEGATQKFTLDGGTSENDLWTEVCEDATGGPLDGAQVVASVWQPTDEERDLIAAGANIELRIWGGQPPVALLVTQTPALEGE